MNYRKYSFLIKDTEAREILIAQLSEMGFDAFEEEEERLDAYIGRDKEEAVNSEVRALSIRYEVEDIAQQNWNAVWEAGYEPVIIEGFCTVRAQFHPPAYTPHEIIITPKMSFGTGHHATTKLMMEAMRGLDIKGKRLLDFGAGTGILAILASKLGAASVVAIDHEEWAAENAQENVLLNNTKGITVYRGSLEQAYGKMFDIILANINRHILLQYMEEMSLSLAANGMLLLSGILVEDEEVVCNAAVKEKLNFVAKTQDGQWMALLFSK